jgi:hypothetical protein
MVLIRRVVWPLFGGLLLSGCGRSDSPKVDSALSPASQSAALPGQPKPACPKTGHWSDCQVKLRLEQSGLAPQIATEKLDDLPSLPGTPTSFHVGNSGLAIYLYADSAARHRAAATLDTMKFIPPSKPVGMRGEATVIANDNMLALLFSRNEHQRERVADAITAGAPQP